MMEFLESVILSGSALVGVVIALSGLNTWRKQLFGRHEYDLVIRVLTLIYRYREGLQHVRNPFSWVEPSKRNEGERKKYSERWETVNDIRAELEAALVAEEAVWGTNKQRESLKALHDLDGELYMAILEHIDQLEGVSEGPKDVEAIRARRCILYRRTRDDEFSARLEAAVDEATKPLRKRLKRFQ